MSCIKLDHPNLAPGYGCCQCKTYNGNQNLNCRYCGHRRCDEVGQAFEDLDEDDIEDIMNVETDKSKLN